ncbi:MAG: hypothetical protein A2010_01890 [Nitrospirae bacterium GWD2_57_9]|nr:MAG: hypothetical protein A2010_01890 [Nitrospirae bacterium GWD2_57_9]OGW47871.1 MAG: hypothetical protein A2078_13285 [Nitrospirae bacterium GWC2_57_9]
MRHSIARLALLIMVLFTATAVFSGTAHAGKKIGILIWNNEARYTESRDGVLEQLKKEGFYAPAVTFTTENAEGNKAKAAELARKFAAAQYDLVIAVGTSMVTAAAAAIKDTPLVFSMVYDPVDSKIAADWTSSGNNTTGSSPKVPMSQLVDALKKLAPVKTMGVLYTPGEKNSEVQLKEMQTAGSAAQIRIIPVPLTNKADVPSLMPDVTARVNAVYLTGSSVVGDAFDSIISQATKAKVITLSHLQDHVEKGALLGVTADPRVVGQMAGAKAAKVLRGAKPASIPIETAKKFEVVLNMKTAKAGPINIPEAFLSSVSSVIK